MRPTHISIILILLIMGFGSVTAGPEDWRIALCISADPAHQMNVAWRTESQVDTPLVQWVQNQPQVKFYKQSVDIAAQTETVVRSDSSLVYAYSAEMSGLKPSTSYAYRVGSAEDWSEWLVFTTAAEKEEPFSFLYFGDPQNGIRSHVSRAIRAGYKEAPDAAFITMAGDLVAVPARDYEWEALFHAGDWIFRQTPLAPIMGNHAYYIDGKWLKTHTPYWQPHFKLPENGLTTLPETNYYFHYQSLLFVVLNGSEQLAEQALWLDELLTRESSAWVVVTLHQPLYATGDGRNGEKRRNAFLPIMDKYEVDLVLQGHDHTFGRTYPLKDNQRAKRWQKGTVYINSVSGSKQYKLRPKQSELFAVSGQDTQYYHVVSVTSSKMTLSSYSVDGVLVDEIQINPSKLR